MAIYRIYNVRSKEGGAHALGDRLPGTINKQLTLGMSGSRELLQDLEGDCDQGVRQLGIT